MKEYNYEYATASVFFFEHLSLFFIISCHYTVIIIISAVVLLAFLSTIFEPICTFVFMCMCAQRTHSVYAYLYGFWIKSFRFLKSKLNT